MRASSLFVTGILAALTAQPDSLPPVKTATPIQVERFGKEKGRPLLILLHGVSGSGAFFRDEAGLFVRSGYRVVIPHYLDAGHGTQATDANYAAWTDAVARTAKAEKEGNESVTVVGYSLGASVALALGSRDDGVDAIAEVYGSLPDKFYREMKGMPPLLILHGADDTVIPVANAQSLLQLCAEANLICESHVYEHEGHGFSGSTQEDAERRILAFLTKVLNSRQAGSASPTH